MSLRVRLKARYVLLWQSGGTILDFEQSRILRIERDERLDIISSITITW